jgi:hypothetical protein
MKRLLIALMVLAFVGVSVGQSYTKKAGATSVIIYVQMVKLSDGTLAPDISDETTIDYSYIEAGQAAGGAAVACSDVALNAAYSSGGTHWVGWGGWFRFDVPNAALDGAIGTDVVINLTDGTYGGDAVIHLAPPVNTYLADGTTLAAVNVASGVVESKVMSVDTDAITAAGLKADAATKIATATWEMIGGSMAPPPSMSSASIWTGVIDSATTNTVVLNATSPTPAENDNAYNGYMLVWQWDEAIGAKAQFHRISGYVASTRTVTIDGIFSGTPAVGDTFSIIPSGIPVLTSESIVSSFAVELLRLMHYGVYATEATLSTSTRNAIYVDHVTSTDDSFLPGTVVLVEVTGGPEAAYECIVVKDFTTGTNKITPYTAMKYTPLEEGNIYVQEHLALPYFLLENIVGRFSGR